MSAPPADRLTLLSSSARRREIVRAAIRNSRIADSRGEEPRPQPMEPPAEYVVRSAVAKLGAPARSDDEGCLIGADTVVVLDGEILGKPRSDSDAARMLRSLSGRRHAVMTGVVALHADSGRTSVGVESTSVRVRRLSEREIDEYVASGKPRDKAGAYAVQDEDFAPSESVEGCYLNVVGLPLCLAVELARGLGATVGLRAPHRIPYLSQCAGCRLEGGAP